jgi:hypothetical protein
VSNEIAVVKQGTYAIASQGAAGADFIRSAFEQGASALTFDRTSVPSGGGTAWTVPSLSGDQSAQAIEGVIAVMQGRQRAWWRQGLDEGGGSLPPSCSSTNGIVGMGDNTLDGTSDASTHECAKCSWSAYGSARKGGAGKDCKEFARLFLFRPSSRMPLVVTVPPTSLKEIQRYAMRLLDAGFQTHEVVTRLKLVTEKNSGGIRYSKIAFEFVGALPEAEREAMKSIAAEVRSGLAMRPVTAESGELNGN